MQIKSQVDQKEGSDQKVFSKKIFSVHIEGKQTTQIIRAISSFLARHTIRGLTNI